MNACTRCGVEIAESVWNRRALRGSTLTECTDCHALKTQHPQHKNGGCKPHLGNVDLDTLQPLDKDGNLLLPGIRTCGNSDCIKPEHIKVTEGKKENA